MIQIKIISNANIKLLERDCNEYIQENRLDVVDVKISISDSYKGMWVAVITYKLPASGGGASAAAVGSGNNIVISSKPSEGKAPPSEFGGHPLNM